MDFNNLNILGKLEAGVEQIVYSNTLTSAATSITISGLDGDTDLEYIFVYKFVVGAVNSSFYLYPNNDSTSGNYGDQFATGTNATFTSARELSTPTGVGSLQNAQTNEIVYGYRRIFSKSGIVRVGYGNEMNWQSGTTINRIWKSAHVWNNTASNITSLVITCSAASGIGVGSVIRLFCRRITG